MSHHAPEPVFLGGDHRSGTTLLSIMLDSHRDLALGPELEFELPDDLGPSILHCCQLLADGDPRVAGEGVDTAEPAFHAGVQFIKQCQRAGVSRAELETLIQRQLSGSPGRIASWEERCRLVQQIGELRTARAGKSRWGMKIQRSISQPAGFSSYWPHARFIHIFRDGRDVAASHLRGRYRWGYQTAEEAARGWLDVVESVERLKPWDQLYELSYEALVRNPQTEMEKLLAWLELPWDANVLRHAEVPHSLFAAPFRHPSAEQSSQPVKQDRIGCFHTDLSPAQIAAFEALAAPALRRLGYPVAASA